MNSSIQRERLLEEIHLMPESKLAEVYAFLHYFRLGLEASESSTDQVMKYAGCWRDMPDEVFRGFAQEIAERRHNAFRGRHVDEAGSD